MNKERGIYTNGMARDNNKEASGLIYSKHVAFSNFAKGKPLLVPVTFNACRNDADRVQIDF
jgi:hypothetical protein